MRTKEELKARLKDLDKEKSNLLRDLRKQDDAIVVEAYQERLRELKEERNNFIKSLTSEEAILVKLSKY